MPFARPDEIHSAFAEALQAGDLDALLDLYEPDAVNALPDGTQVAGADARREMFRGLIASGAAMAGTQRMALVVGDIALTSTVYEARAELGEAPTTVTTAEVSRRQADGSWRVVIDAPAFV